MGSVLQCEGHGDLGIFCGVDLSVRPQGALWLAVSRLSSEFMHGDHEGAPHDRPGTGTAGAKPKVTPALGPVSGLARDERARGVKFPQGQFIE